MRRSVAVLGAVASVVLPACGDTGELVTLVDGVTVTVAAEDNQFVPESLEVAAGTEVVFDNVGRNEHNVIPVDADQAAVRVDTEDLEPGAQAARRLTELGTYRYYCSIHGTETAGMVGTITVTRGTP